METRRFNEEAAKLPNAEVIVVSVDLPFAQKRWCGAAGVDKLTTASDHRDSKFGESYGVLISGGPLDRCLARAVFVVGPDNKVKYVEYVKEITEHPNYEAALAATKK
jgi:thiol peroxidase